MARDARHHPHLSSNFNCPEEVPATQAAEGVPLGIGNGTVEKYAGCVNAPGMLLRG